MPRKKIRKISKRETVILWSVLAIITLIIVMVSVYMFFTLQTDVISATLKDGDNIRMAVVLHDDNTVIASLVAFYQPATGQFMNLLIPTNIGILLSSGNRYLGIAELFDTDNMNAYLEQLSKMLGSTVEWYYMFTPAQLANMLDLLGGITVELIDSTTQERRPLLLNGDTLDYYVGAKQQEVVQEGLEETADEIPDKDQNERLNVIVGGMLLSMSEQVDYLMNSGVQKIFLRNTSTNLDANAWSSLIKGLPVLDRNTMYVRKIHGAYRSIQTSAGEKELLFPYFDGQWLRRTVEQLEDTLTEEAGNMENLFMQVELLNGTSLNGLARRTQSLIERYGFDVVRIGNAKSFNIQKTQIISRSENLASAQRIGEIIQTNNIIYEPGSSSVDVTIVLGADFDGSYVRQ